MVATVLIGNSDNKLTQQEWCAFRRVVNDMVTLYANKMYFAGGPPNWEAWQNAAWVFETEPAKAEACREMLLEVRKRFNQDSIAWVQGETEFV
jgi:ribonuclease HI